MGQNVKNFLQYPHNPQTQNPLNSPKANFFDIFGVCVRIIVMETGALVRAGEGLSCPKSLFVQYICIVFHIRNLCNTFVNIMKRRVSRVSPKLQMSSFAQ